MSNTIIKIIRSITAALLAGTLTVTGAFARNAFDQESINKTKELSKGVGARLHDDFNGINKDVYVENYADEGGKLVFARIRLDQYMELGTDAGNGGTDLIVLRGDKAKDPYTTPVIDDVTTWDTYLYGNTTDGSEQIRRYRDLAFGGDTIYMPTFNKHIYNLDADINGTLEGPDGDILADVNAYMDYETYANGQSVTADAKYATDDQDDDSPKPDDYIEVTETHIAKPTLTSTVMSMEEWKANGSKPGPFWVYDEDGWAYWAQGIDVQTATGLLLTQLTEIESPDSEWYYAINVVLQLTSENKCCKKEVNDKFYEGEITPEGEKLLQQIVGLIEGVGIDITVKTGSVDLQVGDTIELKTTVTVPPEYTTQTGYSWTISEVNGNSGLTQAQMEACFQDDVFTPNAGMIGSSYKLTASSDLNYKVKDSILLYVYNLSNNSD